MAQNNFNPVEATIEDIHAGYRSGQLTCRQVVQAYLDRIEAFDKKGPQINAMITVNADALKEADKLDAAADDDDDDELAAPGSSASGLVAAPPGDED